MVIFGTGVVTGGLLVRHVERGWDRRPQHGGTVVRPAPLTPAGIMRIDFLRRMERELDLTPAQREPIEVILKQSQERMKKIMESVEPRRREEFKRTLDEFRTVLTPEQQKRLDALLKQQQQRAREQRKAAPQRERSPQGSPPGNAPVTNAESGLSAKPATP